MDHKQQSQLIAYAIGGGVFLAIFAFRMRRMMQSRPFRVQNVWILPAVLIALTVLTLYERPPAGSEWAWVIGALALGGLLGWFRAKTIHLSFDPATKEVMAQGSPLAMIFILALFAVRFGLRGLMAAESSALGISIALVDGAFLAMACGLFVARSGEMAIRAVKLINENTAKAPAA